MHLKWAPVCTEPKRNREFSGCRLSVHNVYIIARIKQQVTTALCALKLPQADPISHLAWAGLSVLWKTEGVESWPHRHTGKFAIALVEPLSHPRSWKNVLDTVFPCVFFGARQHTKTFHSFSRNSSCGAAAPSDSLEQPEAPPERSYKLLLW